MPYMSSLERMAYEEGMRDGWQESIAMELEEKFGSSGLQLLESVRQVASIPVLRRILRYVNRAKTVEQIREYLKHRILHQAAGTTS
jgi:hypothetical protein